MWVSLLSCHMYLMEWFYPLQASLSDHLKKKTLLPSRLGEILWGSCILKHVWSPGISFFFFLTLLMCPKGHPKWCLNRKQMSLCCESKPNSMAIWAGSFLDGCLEWTSKKVNPGKPLGTFIIISWWSACWKGVLVSGVEPACSLLIPSTSANTFLWTHHHGLITVT